MEATVGLGPWAAADPVGQRIDEFEVLSLLGAGGMGRVYKALDVRLQRLVAIKMLAPLVAGDRELRARFEREVRALSSLSHPNVAQIYSSGFHQGRPYYAMEYIDGPSLAAGLDAGRHLAGRRCLDLLIQAARGLEAALAKGIIHRDVKPGNLMVDADDHLKVVDFGLARGLVDDSSLTATDRLIGTPLYMAPEQAQGGPVDHRADVYALGATFYHLLTGEPPFEKDTPLALALRHVHSPLTPVKERNPRVPAAVAAIIERMMAKRPQERYGTYGELIADLERARAGVGSAASPVVTGRATGGLPQHRRLIGFASATALVGVALLGLLALRPPRGGPAAGPTEAAPAADSAGSGGVLDDDGRRRAGSRRPQSPPTTSPPAAPTFAPVDLLRQAYATASLANMRRLATAVEVTFAERGELPADLEEVAAVHELHPRALLDGWKRELRYEPGPAPHFRLVSAGADGRFDSDDDLVLEDGYFLDEPVPDFPGLP